MSVRQKTPSYAGLTPATATASAAARGASAKRDTKPELLLRRALWARGLRYRVDVRGVLGRPDILLSRSRIVVFCDGDFWHGRDLKQRLKKLRKGHNATYWVSKIRTNVKRDRRRDAQLVSDGWLVLRFWETDVAADPDRVANEVLLNARVRLKAHKRRSDALNRR